MPETKTTYATLQDPFTATVEAVPAPAWDQPSPCEGWSARDVLQHVVDTQRDFLSGHGVDLGDTPDLTDPAAGWQQHADDVLDLLADPTVAATAFESHFGPTTVGDTMERFYGFDLLVHRWDIATAAGLDRSLTAEELDRIETGIAGFGPALYSEGICKPALDTDPDAPRQVRILALLGRREAPARV